MSEIKNLLSFMERIIVVFGKWFEKVNKFFEVGVLLNCYGVNSIGIVSKDIIVIFNIVIWNY